MSSVCSAMEIIWQTTKAVPSTKNYRIKNSHVFEEIIAMTYVYVTSKRRPSEYYILYIIVILLENAMKVIFSVC